MSQPAKRLSQESERPSDADLATWIRDGDVEAFSSMVRMYYDGLCAFVASMLGRAHEEEEIVQDLLFHVWEHRSTWHPRESIRAYLYGAARKRALNRIRRGHLEIAWARSARDNPSAACAGRGPGAADESLALSDLSRRCRLALTALPPRRREIYVLHRQHQLSHAEIASVLGIAEKTVEAQIGLALKALRVHLADWLP